MNWSKLFCCYMTNGSNLKSTLNASLLGRKLIKFYWKGFPKSPFKSFLKKKKTFYYTTNSYICFIVRNAIVPNILLTSNRARRTLSKLYVDKNVSNSSVRLSAVLRCGFGGVKVKVKPHPCPFFCVSGSWIHTKKQTKISYTKNDISLFFFVEHQINYNSARNLYRSL